MNAMTETTAKKPTRFTIEKNKATGKALQIDDKNPTNEEVELAKSHLLKDCNDLQFEDENGNVIWSHSDFDFYNQEKIPDSVNPSLWLNGKGLYPCGIYSVVGKDIIQVRGFDIANINFIRGKTKWIILDTGSTAAGIVRAIKEVEEYLHENIHDHIDSVIVSHSHGDHFGGLGPVKEYNPNVKIYVPKGFEAATRDEYVYAGKAMKYRSGYQVGAGVEAGEYGRVSVGCGLSCIPAPSSYAAPTNEITEDTTLVIDGIHIDFQITNETEAVANMQNYFHEYKALWVADNCIGTLHNLYTMRGAKIRDALIWSQALYDTAIKYGDIADVIFQGHGSPHWNTKEKPDMVKEVLLNHAAVYKNIHDQTLAAVSRGVRYDELVKQVKIPEELKKVWYLRPYYGTYETNIKAIYQKYLGFYDGNPINLNPLTKKEFAEKLVEYVGSADKVLEHAKANYLEGEYQAVAEMTGYLLQLDPKRTEVRNLCADALEQLGYQTESSIWRNGYLKAARELRNKSEVKPYIENDVLQVLSKLNGEQVLQYLGLALDYQKVDAKNRTFFVRIDAKDVYRIDLYKKTFMQTKLNDTDSTNKVIDVRKDDLIDAIGGNNNESNEFLKFISENTENILKYPIHLIAPGI